MPRLGCSGTHPLLSLTAAACLARLNERTCVNIPIAILADDRPVWPDISYLRVSVTDRCDLRCFYCMSEDMTFLPKADLLTLEDSTGYARHSSPRACGSCG